MINTYDAMATEMEKKTLKSPDIGKPEKAAVIRQLTKLLIVYIRAALGEEAKNFGEGSVKVSSVVDAVRKAKRTSGLIISSQGVQQWHSSKAGAMLPTLPGESAVLGKRPAAASVVCLGASPLAWSSPDHETMATRVMMRVMMRMAARVNQRQSMSQLSDRGMGRCRLCRLRLCCHSC